jgi:hypothetical protein
LIARFRAIGIARVIAITRMIIRLANGWCTIRPKDDDAVLA